MIFKPLLSSAIVALVYYLNPASAPLDSAPWECEEVGCASYAAATTPSLHWGWAEPPASVKQEILHDYAISIIVYVVDRDDGTCECEGAPGPEVCVEQLNCEASITANVVWTPLCVVNEPETETASTNHCDNQTVHKILRLFHCNPAPSLFIVIHVPIYAHCDKCADETC